MVKRTIDSLSNVGSIVSVMADSTAGASCGRGPQKSAKRKKTVDDLAQKEKDILKQLEESYAELKKESSKLKAKKKPKQRVLTAVYGRPDPSGKRAEYNARQRRNYRARILKKQRTNFHTAGTILEEAVQTENDAETGDHCSVDGDDNGGGDDDVDGMWKIIILDQLKLCLKTSHDMVGFFNIFSWQGQAKEVSRGRKI